MRLSISKIKLFKSCRRAYELKYIEGLEPVQKSDALQTGSIYHSKLEEIYNNGYCDVDDNSKESAMAFAYEKYIYPKFKVMKAEAWLEYNLGNGDKLVGICDAIAEEDGHIVEHKTTSAEITEEFEFDLQWDEQILAYMLMTGARKVWYTVIRKPTIRQRRGESDEDFFYRMIRWYDEDTDKKIRLFEITRTDEEVELFKDELFKMLDEMKTAEKNKHLYKNTTYCKHWGRRCEYASVCLHYDPNQKYVEFKRKE